MSVLGALVRNSTLLLVGTACAKGLVLVSTLILGRKLGPEGFGLYSLVFAYLAFFELLPDAGLDALVVRDLARSPADASRRLGDAVLLRTLLLLAVVPVAALLFGRITHRDDGAWLVALAGTAILSSNRRASLRSLVEAPYRASLDMGIPALLGVLSEALHVAILAWLIARAGVTGAVGAQTLASLPFFVLLALLSARRVRPRLRFERARLTALLAAAAPLLGGLAVNVVLARADAVMLERMRGTRDVGLYMAPVRIVEIMNLLPILLMTSVYPLFAASHPHDPVRVDRLFRGSLRVLVTGLVPVAAAMIVFATPLVHALFGAPYAESAAALPALALSGVFVVCDIVLTARLVATGAERRNFVLVAIAAAANVSANLWLIPRYGPRGAAFANLLAYVVRLLAGLAFSDVRATTRRAIESIAPALGAGLLAFAPSILFEGLRTATFAAGLALYPIALYLLGGMSLRDMLQLRHALQAGVERAGDVGRDPRGG
jgi:O-antigen/teichoic acid export membrane protein